MNLHQDFKTSVDRITMDILLKIYRCYINMCFTILKPWWRFIKTETFKGRLSF